MAPGNPNPPRVQAQKSAPAGTISGIIRCGIVGERSTTAASNIGYAKSSCLSEPCCRRPVCGAAIRPRSKRPVLSQERAGCDQLQLSHHDTVRAGQAAQLARSMYSALSGRRDNGQLGSAPRQPASAQGSSCQFRSSALRTLGSVFDRRQRNVNVSLLQGASPPGDDRNRVGCAPRKLRRKTQARRP